MISDSLENQYKITFLQNIFIIVSLSISLILGLGYCIKSYNYGNHCSYLHCFYWSSRIKNMKIRCYKLIIAVNIKDGIDRRLTLVKVSLIIRSDVVTVLS